MGEPSLTRSETPAERALERALVNAHWLFIVPVLALVIAAAGAFIYGLGTLGHGVYETVKAPYPLTNNIGAFLAVIDLFLIGATLMIGAIGFYQLFFRREIRKPSSFPHQLEVRSFDELKSRVIVMIILVVTVSFAEVVVSQQAALTILEFGAGVAAVILVLVALLRWGTAERADS
jgi:uncharacterized membrane protein YqhA